MQHLEIMVLPFGNHGDILGLLQIFELIGGWNLCMPERVMFIAQLKSRLEKDSISAGPK